MKTSQAFPIPFSPLPAYVLERYAAPFAGLAASLEKIFPMLELELDQAGIKTTAQTYLSIAMLVCVFHFFLWTIVAAIFVYRFFPENIIILPPTLGLVFAGLVFIQIIFYPRIQIKKKVREVEKNLVFALRTLTIQIRSGVSLFDALSLVSYGTYGGLSHELKRALDEINAGIPEEEALQRAAIRTPSIFFRRSLWQVVNGLKAGADITLVLTELVHTMTKEQVIQIKRYGADLRLMSLIYMMLGVIIPALGLTFLVILSTFPDSPISELMLWGFLGFIVISQFMFVGFMKSKRPSLMGDE